MTGQFVALGCTSCGAKLDVYEGKDRYTCGYCGTEMMVERTGSDVTVHGLADMLRDMHAGASKAAAEMALARYQQELTALREEHAAREARANDAAGKTGLFGAVILLVGLIALFSGGVIFALIAFVLGGFVARHAWGLASRDSSDTPVRRRMVELKARIAEKERIANE